MKYSKRNRGILLAEELDIPFQKEKEERGRGQVLAESRYLPEKERDLLQFGEAQVMIFLPDKAAQKRKVYFKNKAF